MRWIRYSLAGRTSYGVVEGDKVVAGNGDPFVGWERSGQRHALADITCEVPVTPPTFYCVGLNYTEHVLMAARKLGIKADLPTQPDVGYRAVNALIAHGQNVVIPRHATEQIHYEGELAVIIGKKTKHVSEADALKCVLGYTIGNDVSERTWQKSDKTLWRAKNTDTFKPMGPWIETEVPDLDKLETIVRVNGVESSRFATNAMIFGVARFIATMSTCVTLWPGDMIWMGTDGKSPNLKHGDVCEVEISGIGVLRNPFVREGL